MAEKPRLKETDEIFSSIGRSNKRSVVLQPAVGDSPAAAQPDTLIESALDRAASSEIEIRDDNNPLDFSKYNLASSPKRRSATKNAIPSANSPSATIIKEGQAATEQPTESIKPPTKPSPPRRGRPPQSQTQKQDEQAVTPNQQVGEGSPTPPKKSRKTVAKEPQTQTTPQISDYTFTDFSAPSPEENEPLAVQSTDQQSQTDTPPSDGRNDFLKKLSSQFEEEFSQKFESPTARSDGEAAAKESWFDTIPPVRSGGNNSSPPPLHPQEELELHKETEQFLSQFEESVKKEESSRSESFKETLAEKFLRERQRYLRDLGIDIDSPPPQPEQFEGPDENSPQPQPEPIRRRLDLQIQPEMHMPENTVKQVKPVTYNRGAQTTVQDGENLDELPYLPRDVSGKKPPAPVVEEALPPAKKTSEQLLLELAVQNSFKGLRTPPEEKPQSPANVSPPQSSEVPNQLLRFQFAPVEEDDGKKGKKQRKKKTIAVSRTTIFISAAAALVLIALVALPLTTWLNIKNDPSSEPIGEMTNASATQDTLTVYETRQFQTRGKITDMMIKKSGILVENCDVANHLVIGDITSQGAVTLKNITVGGTIYLKDSAVNKLILEDVSAKQIIINNPTTRVEVSYSGNTNIDTVEFKTPADLYQTSLNNSALGVENLLLSGTTTDNVLDTKISGAKLYSLTTIGDSIVALSDASRVTNLTSEGSLSLSGDGTVMNLSSNALPDGEQASLQLKNASIQKLTLAGPATITVDNRIDTIAISDSLSMGGKGVVGGLYINPPASSKRLVIDLSGVNVHSVFSDAQTRIDSGGTSLINELTANDSVYALGNKLNHLIVKADGVVYEKEPDKITTLPGVRPAQTVADNPNLDFNLSTTENIRPLDLSADDLATTCNHPRESGGFTKGDGSLSDPFEVSTALQLAHISSHLDSHFLQTANIDFTDESKFASGFDMIGGKGTPFTGVYDGNGHALVNLKISSSSESVGLFAENTGTISNIHLRSGDIRSTANSSGYVGAIVGFNYDGGVIDSCANGAKVTAPASVYGGGIAGYNSGGKIRNSYNAAKISGQTDIGGITGVNRNNGSISNSYNVGTIEGISDFGAVSGTNSGGAITNCYYLVETAAVGIGSGSGNVVEKTSDQLSEGQMVLDLGAGNDNSPWLRPATTDSYTYPVLKSPLKAQQ